MAITLSQLAQITARAGVGRAGTMRAGCAPKSYELKPASGEILWNRPTASDGNPATTASNWTNVRE